MIYGNKALAFNQDAILFNEYGNLYESVIKILQSEDIIAEGTFLEKVKETVKNIIEKIKAAFGKVIQFIQNTAKKVWGALGPTFKKVINAIANLSTTIQDIYSVEITMAKSKIINIRIGDWANNNSVYWEDLLDCAKYLSRQDISEVFALYDIKAAKDSKSINKMKDVAARAYEFLDIARGQIYYCTAGKEEKDDPEMVNKCIDKIEYNEYFKKDRIDKLMARFGTNTDKDGNKERDADLFGRYLNNAYKFCSSNVNYLNNNLDNFKKNYNKINDQMEKVIFDYASSLNGMDTPKTEMYASGHGGPSLSDAKSKFPDDPIQLYQLCFSFGKQNCEYTVRFCSKVIEMSVRFQNDLFRSLKNIIAITSKDKREEFKNTVKK